MRIKALAETNLLYDELKQQKEAYTEQIIHRALMRMQHATIANCFFTMAEHAREAKEQKVRVTRTLARWTKRCLVNTFHGWTSFANVRKKHRQICVRVCAKVEHQAVAAALGKWRSFMMEESKMRVEKEKLILKLSNGLAGKKDIQQILVLVVEQATRLMDASALRTNRRSIFPTLTMTSGLIAA